MQRRYRDPSRKRLWLSWTLRGFLVCLSTTSCFGAPSLAQEDVKRTLTPFQLEIHKQRERLRSEDPEERRDAVMQLKALRHPEASRVAASALNDNLVMVRATAAGAVLSLPADEAAATLLPLLDDKDEFVRQETAYALGQTRSRTAVVPLMERLISDKKDGVRGAAAVALGEIADQAAVVLLAQVLAPQMTPPGSKAKRKIKENEFVLRAAAHSLGQIGSPAGVQALIITLEDENLEDDLRREAAFALGLIGDPSARQALQRVLTARDPYLFSAADKALRKIRPTQ